MESSFPLVGIRWIRCVEVSAHNHPQKSRRREVRRPEASMLVQSPKCARLSVPHFLEVDQHKKSDEECKIWKKSHDKSNYKVK